MFLHEAVDALSAPFQGEKSLYSSAEGVVLRNNRKGPSILVRQSLVSDWPMADPVLKGLRDDLRRASPFSFENIPIELNGAEVIFPGIGNEGMTVFNDGDAPLPEDVCWFEIALSARSQLGLLLVSHDDAFEVVEFSRGPDRLGNIVLTVLPYRLTLTPTFGEPPEAFLAESGADPWTILAYTVHQDTLSIWPRAVEYQRMLMRPPVRERDLVMTMLREPTMAIYCLLVLRSNRRTIEIVKPKAFGNRRRREKGLTLIPEYRSVTIAGDWRPGRISAAESEIDEPEAVE
ncbi:hypothetical protein ACVIGB_000872 [Bradyrhizobium sp. USDA 4341]